MALNCDRAIKCEQCENCQVENQFTSKSCHPFSPSSRPPLSYLRGFRRHLNVPDCGVLSSFRSMPACFSPLPAIIRPSLTLLEPLLPGFRTAQFLRGMEDEFSTSTFFGILLLKRLSRVTKRTQPQSRGTLKAQREAIVKYNFWMIFSTRSRPGLDG